MLFVLIHILVYKYIVYACSVELFYILRVAAAASRSAISLSYVSSILILDAPMVSDGRCAAKTGATLASTPTYAD